MSGTEYDFEPTPGLPQRLPPGEDMLWQGKPDPFILAKRVFRLHWVMTYFAILVLWRLLADIHDGLGILGALSNASTLLVLGLCAVAFFGFLAWMMQRATIYTITTKRIVMRVGAVFEVAINLPFKGLVSADLKKYRDGSGDIILSIVGTGFVSYWMLWPHVRPWRYLNIQPVLRGLASPEPVADMLAEAIARYAANESEEGTDPIAVNRPEPQPQEMEIDGVAPAH